MKILAHVSQLTADRDDTILALGNTDEERRHKFMTYYRNLFAEAPNFAHYVDALGSACGPDERQMLLVNLWIALEKERQDGKSTIMKRLLNMQVCNESKLAEFVRGKPKTIRACLEYLELLF